MTEPTQHCDHRNAEVTQTECGLCWLRLEGDAEFYLDTDRHWNVRSEHWDECRARHIGREGASQSGP